MDKIFNKSITKHTICFLDTYVIMQAQEKYMTKDNQNFEKDINVPSKQIIIDNIDVSGCEWIREVGLDSEYICTCNSPNKTSGYCKYNPNCCYKQLKTENELARQLINWILNFFELTDYDWQADQNEISDLIRDCFDDKQSTIDFVTDINKSLLAKLTEIKEIAENAAKCLYVTKSDDYTDGYCWLGSIILQKISEVVDE